jgi:hypothetical protein
LEVESSVDELFHDPLDTLDADWTTTGLWRIANAESCNLEEPTGSVLMYNEKDLDTPTADQPDCDYDTGQRTSGSAVVETVDVSDWTKIGIQFDHRHTLGTDALQDEDQATFDASLDGGETWFGANATERGCGTAVNDAGQHCWDDDSYPQDDLIQQTWVLDLTEHQPTSEPLQLRWSFDSQDRFDNDHLGWLIDDVTVLGLE